jgi:uncharacterized DUF497 family protein
VEFRWNSWNEKYVERHGVAPDEAEEVVLGAKSPFPLAQDDEKFLVWGPTEVGRLVQVVFVIDPGHAIFVIHARPLTEREKKRYRRRVK